MRIVGKHAAIFNVVPLLSVLDPECEATVDLGDGAGQAGHFGNNNWWENWIALSSGAPIAPLVPAGAQAIYAPLNIIQWGGALRDHPNQPLVQFFLTGVREGFRIGYGYDSSSLKSARRNLDCAMQHEEVVSEYLRTEIHNGRVSGPFKRSEVQGARMSRFGVIPKNHQANKWRLIVDLSRPDGHSVNDGMPESLCGLSCVSVDDATDHLCTMGPGTLMAKIDIKSAFRLLPVHPADRLLLAMEWKGSIFFDNCLPFGLRSAPRLFSVLAELLEWIAEQSGVAFSIHYLDDFLTMGPWDTPICGHNLKVFTQLCHQLGVPLALEKVEGPATCLTFLGISMDSRSVLAGLPNEKLERIRNEISVWISRKTATGKQILSLVGLLQHATKVVRPGRTFVARMYSTAAKLKKLKFFTRLTKEFKSDLCWWHTFLHSWNGLSLLDHVSAAKPPDYYIQTDASGAWGCGGIFKQHWFQLSWSTEWSATGIMAKELVPIVISCAIWPITGWSPSALPM